MKILNKVLTLVLGLAMILTLSIGVSAIGFDAEKSYDSVFVVTSGNSLGSGFAIGENCIITNAHVVTSPQNTKITTYEGIEYRATVLAMNEDMDIAVLSVAGVTFPYLTVANYNDSKIGDDVYAIGAPNGMTYTLTKGTLSAKDRVIGNYTYIQLDAALNQGNSGGPLLTDAGTVIGVNSMKLNNSEGIGLAIPMTTVCEYLRSVGIDVDGNGNVIGNVGSSDIGSGTAGGEGVTSPQSPESVPDTGNGSHAGDVEYVIEQEPLNKVLLICLIASVLLNVILLIWLVAKFYGNRRPKLTDKDRTDFDIEILE